MEISNHDFTVALTHDVDRVHKSFQSATHFLKHLRQGRVQDALYQARSFACFDRYWCFDRICEIEASRGVKSTWFFLNESYPFRPWKARSWRLALGYYDIYAPAVSGIMRQLDYDGYEIGVHGSYRSFADRALLKKEKKDIENILGHPVHGVRQHYLNLAPETWGMQRELGFSYDASFGYRDSIGFQDNRYQPFPLDERNDFFIVPQAVMDSCLMRQSDPWCSALKVIDTAKRNRALLVLNWHQQIFDEREYPGYSRMYMRILDECLNKGGRVVLLGELIQECFAAPNSLSQENAR